VCHGRPLYEGFPNLPSIKPPNAKTNLKKKQSKLADAKATIRGLFDQIKTERLQHEEQLMQERSKYEKEPGTQTTIPSQQQQQQQNSENPQNLLIPLDVVRKRVSFAIDRSEITNSDPLSPPQPDPRQWDYGSHKRTTLKIP